MRDALLDLFLGSACAVCGSPGRALCQDCAAGLPSRGSVCWPTPCPRGLAVPVAAGEYDGALRSLVLAHKEHARFALARPLGELLAVAVGELVAPAPPGGGPVRWLLVPVPSRGAVVRGRGHDPLLRVARVAAALLRHRGHDVRVLRLLRSARVAQDQAGLTADARAHNLAGSLRCPASGAVQRLRRDASTRVVVVDDVVTTGSTAREAQRALEDAGVRVTGVAAVAATRRRSVTARPSPPSLPFWGAGD